MPKIWKKSGNPETRQRATGNSISMRMGGPTSQWLLLAVLIFQTQPTSGFLARRRTKAPSRPHQSHPAKSAVVVTHYLR